MQQQPSPTEIAWAAGLFEGEGTFFATARQRLGAVPLVYPRAALKMTDEDVVRRFHDVVGVGKVWRESPRSGRKPVWVWQVGSRKGYAYVESLLRPWLSPRRQAQLARVAAQLSPVIYDYACHEERLAA